MSDGQLHALRPGAVAVPEGQLGAVGGAARRVVEAAAGLRVAQRLAGRDVRPLLRSGAVAVPQLELGRVRGAAAGHVEALAERPDRAVTGDRPLLGDGAVTGPDLHLGTVGRARGVHVDALTDADHVDRTTT